MKTHSALDALDAQVCWISLARSDEDVKHVAFLIKSLRNFGGSLRSYPIVLFATKTNMDLDDVTTLEDVLVIHHEVDNELRNYWFGDKVAICAKAEEILEDKVQSLVWMNPRALILRPPILFELTKSTQAAFRPVHIQNVGLSADQDLDPYWNKIYQEIGLGDTVYRVESYVDMQWIWPYFNTHLFAIDPRQAVLRTWLNHFTTLITDVGYQEGACSGVQHRIFLHQAILSALLVKSIELEQIRILPSEYSYPLHLHREITPERRVTSLNDLVCPVFEGNFLYPDTVNDIEIEEPVLSWIHENKPDIAS